MRFYGRLIISCFVAVPAIAGCGSPDQGGSTGASAPTTVSADEGSSTDWHLEEHDLTTASTTTASVVADCRGNNTLSWEVRVPDGQTFPEPSHVGVFCGLYSSRPPNDESFHGWGWNRTNWPGTDQGCTFDTRHAYGEESCTDYFRAQRDQVQITAPWCRVTFTYAAPVTLNARIVTYCVTR